MNAAVDFDLLYRDADPFSYRASWYEQRKRDLLLAMLPKPAFSSAWEWGCSNGELTARLAPRCHALWATDVSARAVQHARARMGGLPSVQLQVAKHPQHWPQTRHELIVFSEVGYYLDDRDFRTTVDGFRAAVELGTVLVACHWKPDFEEAFRTGTQVHAALAGALGAATWHYEDEDFILDGWWREPRTLAAQEAKR